MHLLSGTVKGASFFAGRSNTMEKKILFTSESVTEGHPDKICDIISDSVLDEMLRQDPSARVACETTATTGIITVMGEITAEAYVDLQSLVRDVVCNIGYNKI